jgi:hypothetical protein
MSSPLFYVIITLGLLTALVVVEILHHKTQTRWMRIFCATRDIPTHIMERANAPEPEEAHMAPPLDTRKRMTVPLPGANLFRDKGSPFKQ